MFSFLIDSIDCYYNMVIIKQLVYFVLHKSILRDEQKPSVIYLSVPEKTLVSTYNQIAQETHTNSSTTVAALFIILFVCTFA